MKKIITACLLAGTLLLGNAATVAAVTPATEDTPQAGRYQVISDDTAAEITFDGAYLEHDEFGKVYYSLGFTQSPVKLTMLDTATGKTFTKETTYGTFYYDCKIDTVLYQTTQVPAVLTIEEWDEYGIYDLQVPTTVTVISNEKMGKSECYDEFALNEPLTLQQGVDFELYKDALYIGTSFRLLTPMPNDAVTLYNEIEEKYETFDHNNAVIEYNTWNGYNPPDDFGRNFIRGKITTNDGVVIEFFRELDLLLTDATDGSEMKCTPDESSEDKTSSAINSASVHSAAIGSASKDSAAKDTTGKNTSGTNSSNGAVATGDDMATITLGALVILLSGVAVMYFNRNKGNTAQCRATVK